MATIPLTRSSGNFGTPESTLTVWFGDPSEEYICEETGDQVILMKDKRGQVIGFEKLHFSIPDHEQLGVAVDAST